jgi:O-antigen ligase
LELVLSSSEAEAYLIEIDAVEPLGHVARLLNDALAAGICLLLAFGALAFGGVQEWAMCVLEIGAALLMAVWVARELFDDRLEILPSPLSVPVFLFAGLVVVQLLLHRTVYWYGTWQKALLWAAYAMLGFLTTQCFRDRVSLKRLSIFFAVFGYLVALLAIAQEFAGNGKIYWVVADQSASRFFGPYSNHAHYAGLMEMLVPFPLVLAMTDFLPGPMRGLYSFAAVIMGSTIFLSKSLGGILAFAVELGVLAILSAGGRGTRRQLALLGSFCLLLISCLMLLGTNGLWERLTQLQDPLDKTHAASRITIVEDSFKMVRQRPLLGWGFGTFPVVYPSFRSFYTDLAVNAAHNDFVELLVETGLLGFALMVAFIYLLYRTGVRSVKHWRHDPRASTALAALVGCTGLVVHSFLDFNLEIPANAALFFALAAIATGGATLREPLHAPILSSAGKNKNDASLSKSL